MTYQVSARSKALTQAGLPAKTGLYDPANEHDACGVGMIANINNDKSHRVIADGLRILANLEHRGAVGADPKAGDGAGILLQIPHDFFVTEAKRIGFKLPEAGDYGVGFVFLPRDPAVRERIEQIFAKAALEEDLEVLGWRDVLVNKDVLGTSVLPTEPFHRQVFVARGPGFKDTDPLAFARKLFVMRKVVSNRVTAITDTDSSGYYVVSMSPDTIIYKGLVLGVNLGDYYTDLKNPKVTSALALVHQRFSTNTFPSWPLAHPYRMICHNGEINTLRGNYNWMAARYATMSSDLFGDDMEKLWPISYEGQSDSACFDNALELLCSGGYPLSHAMMMLIPEAWAGNPLMDENRRSFYEYHAALMEPWDGPAAIAFTDGRQIGATLDRNGLRPARYLVSNDGFVMLASEMGVLSFAEDTIRPSGACSQARCCSSIWKKGASFPTRSSKTTLSTKYPYREWLDRTQILLKDCRRSKPRAPQTNVALLDRQQAFGYTQEDLKFLIAPMAQTGQEAIGSMGTDTPMSALSSRPKLLHTYFKQLFAQVTNPPIDPIREELVMSLVSFIGPRPNLLDLKAPRSQKRLEVPPADPDQRGSGKNPGDR